MELGDDEVDCGIGAQRSQRCPQPCVLGALGVARVGRDLVGHVVGVEREHGHVAVPEGVMPLEKTVDVALKEPFCMIGSDGGIQFETRANCHPRGAACFSTAIRHAMEINMPFETIIEKMTTLPASLVKAAMKARGFIEDGAIADVTVFDPASIRGNATVENPNQFSSGIDLVIVNGKIAFKDKKLQAKSGTAIQST